MEFVCFIGMQCKLFSSKFPRVTLIDIIFFHFLQVKIATFKYPGLGLYSARSHVFGLSSTPSVFSKVIYFGVLIYVQVQLSISKELDSFGQPFSLVLVINFTNNVGQIWFTNQKNVCRKKLYI